MKEFFRKALAVGLALTLLLSLAACGPKNSGEVEPSPSPSETVDDLDNLGVNFLPDNETDVAEKLLGFPNDTVLFTANGKGITAEEYLYWLGNMTAYYEMMYSYYGGGYGGGLDFSAAIGDDGLTWDQQLKEIAYQNCMLLAVTPEAAAQYGVTLDDDDLAELIQQRESNLENAGGEETYAYQLQAMGINDKTAFRLDQVSALFSKLEETYTDMVLNGDGPEALTDEKMAAYIQEEGLLRAKHILLLTKDMTTGEEYDDAKKAEQKAKAEDILAQLRQDPSRFDDLMNENSEDTGLAAYPDGYLFGPGEMVTEFEEGTKALEVGSISDLIQSDFGYHIILRLDADGEDTRSEYATARFNEMMQERVDSATVEKMEEYDSFTAEGYYTAITEFQDSLEEPDTQDKSDATLEPQPTSGAEPTPGE